MTRILNIGRQVATWWNIVKYLLAVIVVVFLICQGLHPVWGILLFIFRKAAIRVCIFLILLYWLTQGLIQ